MKKSSAYRCFFKYCLGGLLGAAVVVASSGRPIEFYEIERRGWLSNEQTLNDIILAIRERGISAIEGEEGAGLLAGVGTRGGL